MNNYCASCGAPIPDNQKFCSMCYSDPEYGSDGYYRDWLNEMYRQEAEQAQEIEAQEEAEDE